MRWSGASCQQQCRHRHRLAFAQGRRGAADMVRQMVGGGAARLAAAIPAVGLAPASKASWRRSTEAWSDAAWRCWSISAGPRPTARWRSRCRRRAARPGRDLQCADRRGRRHGGDRILRRVEPGDGRSTAEELYAGAIVEHEPANRSEVGVDEAPVGLHARPSVKLTKLAKSFGCRIEMAQQAPARGSMPRASSG